MILVMIRYLWPSSDTKVQGAATGGIGDSFVLFPRILWCGVPFARAFPPREATYGRLVCYHSAYITRGFGVLGVFYARFPPREASLCYSRAIKGAVFVVCGLWFVVYNL